MSRSNKARPALAAWGRLLAMLGLVALAASCTNTVSDIGVGLPDSNAETGAFLIDTLTIRSSTVLRDSVVTSTSPYLYVGQYTDPLLGKLTAKSAFRLGLAAPFVPDQTAVFDSISLILKPDNYRYGDTTKTQALVEVRRLNTGVAYTKYSFASPGLTVMDYDSTKRLNYSASPGNLAPRGRARPNITTLRLPLDPAFGQEIMARGKAGRLSTQDDLDNYLPGLAITPATDDEAAILRLSATSPDAVMHLYYHLPTDPTTVLTSDFSLVGGGRHFFQIRANRLVPGTIPKIPRASLQPISSTQTGERTIIEGALGLQTRLEFPYLADLRQYGNNLTITSAQVTAYVPTATLTPFVPAPPALSVYFTDANNHPTGLYRSGVAYNTGISPITAIEQGAYSWSIAEYCQGVLANTIPNNGLLVASATPDVPSRVLLGSARNTQNKLGLRIYFIRVQ